MFSIALSPGVAVSNLPTKCDCATLQPSKIHTTVSVSSAWQVHRIEPPLEEAVLPSKVCLSLLRVAAEKKKVSHM